MSIKITYRESRMVVVVTTVAVALGVGAFAACVVPWFYKKSDDEPDDDGGVAAFRSVINPIDRSRYCVNEDASPGMGSRPNCLRALKFLKLVIPKSCVSSSTSERSSSGESARWKRTTPSFERENSSIAGTSFLTQGSRRSDDFELGTLRVSKYERNKRFSDVTEFSKIENEASPSRLPPIIEENPLCDRLSSDSSKEITVEPLLPRESDRSVKTPLTIGTSENGDESSTNNDLGSQETDMSFNSRENSSRVSTSPAPFWINPGPRTGNQSRGEVNNRNLTIEESCHRSISLVRLDSIDPEESVALSEVAPKELTTRRMQRSPAATRDLPTFFGPTRILKLAIVESSKMAEFLESIDKISVSTEISQEVLSDRFASGNGNWSMKSCSPRDSDRATRINAAEERSFSTGAASRLNECTACKNQKKVDKRFSRFSDGFKRFWRGMKHHKGSESSGGEDRSGIQLIKSLSRKPEVPVGHSTLSNVESTRSSIYKYNLLQRYDDPRIIRIFHTNDREAESSKYAIKEQPLDLSIRREIIYSENMEYDESPDFDEEIMNSVELHRQRKVSLNNPVKRRIIPDFHEKNEDLSSSVREDDADAPIPKRQVLRELVNFLRVRRVSASNEDGATRSDSIKFYHDPSASLLRDENENIVTKHSDPGVKLKKKKILSFKRENDTQRTLGTGDSTNKNGRGLSQKLKKVLNFRNKKNDKNSSLKKNKRSSSSVSDEFQRVPLETIPKSKKNIATIDSRNSECQNPSSCMEMQFIMSNDDDCIGPCTEL